jgi:hypothetical protein
LGGVGGGGEGDVEFVAGWAGGVLL